VQLAVELAGKRARAAGEEGVLGAVREELVVRAGWAVVAGHRGRRAVRAEDLATLR